MSQCKEKKLLLLSINLIWLIKCNNSSPCLVCLSEGRTHGHTISVLSPVGFVAGKPSSFLSRGKRQYLDQFGNSTYNKLFIKWMYKLITLSKVFTSLCHTFLLFVGGFSIHCIQREARFSRDGKVGNSQCVHLLLSLTPWTALEIIYKIVDRHLWSISYEENQQHLTND